MAMKYLIHTYQPRMWYVEEFIVPSMIEQGIDKDDIDIFVDDGTLGNLHATMKSYETLTDRNNITWHLQDDICICHDFAERTQSFKENVFSIICGYCFKHDDYYIIRRTGRVKADQMWYSFPCILIPNTIAFECAGWFYRDAQYRPEFQNWVSKNKYDDALFKEFIERRYSNGRLNIVNLVPNLVDHVDYLIGGSSINEDREKYFKESRAAWFNDGYLVDELAKKLEERRKLKEVNNANTN